MPSDSRNAPRYHAAGGLSPSPARGRSGCWIRPKLRRETSGLPSPIAGTARFVRSGQESMVEALARVGTRKRRAYVCRPLIGHFIGRVLRDTRLAHRLESGPTPGKVPASGSLAPAQKPAAVALIACQRGVTWATCQLLWPPRSPGWGRGCRGGSPSARPRALGVAWRSCCHRRTARRSCRFVAGLRASRS